MYRSWFLFDARVYTICEILTSEIVLKVSSAGEKINKTIFLLLVLSAEKI